MAAKSQAESFVARAGVVNHHFDSDADADSDPDFTVPMPHHCVSLSRTRQDGCESN
jgi:hypothetical protein